MSLPPCDPAVRDHELVTIRVFRGRPDYLMARWTLEQEGVPCFSRAELARRQLDKSQTTPAGDFAVIVRKADLEKAVAILDAPLPPDGYVIDEWPE